MQHSMTTLDDANNLIKPRLVSFREFYNHSLDHIDVMAEFRQWESPASHSGYDYLILLHQTTVTLE